MITPNQLFKLMKQYGVQSCEVTGPDGQSINARMPDNSPKEVHSPLIHPSIVVPSPQEGAEELDNSAAMPDYNGGSPYTGDAVYDDPDLYPDGVDPVAELKQRLETHYGVRPDKSE